MAKAIACDGCGTVVVLTVRNTESEFAEESAWITLSANGVRDHYACTRQCVKDILDGQFGTDVDDAYAAVADVVRVIREARAAELDDDV